MGLQPDGELSAVPGLRVGNHRSSLAAYTYEKSKDIGGMVPDSSDKAEELN